MPEISTNESSKEDFNLPVPGLEFFARVEVDLGTLLDVGEIQAGRRRIVPITGGRFSGPLIQGRILPGGADWQIVEKDGTCRVDARYTLETTEGDLIYLNARGIRSGKPNVLAALARGEVVDPREYYFRTILHFETGSSQYLRLNNILGMGAGMRLARNVVYNAYLIT